ncbi:zf-HC2 domain-containing protein [Actinoplanes sp. NPDC051470]|uniref:zf-HC2 domain-containing protein n=1 Tax=unclassified Actinoplanes TaxID=2626549 RepID=UPI0034160037
MGNHRCADKAVHNLLGLHILGRLAPADQARTRRHLDECTACSADVVELAGITSYLNLLSPDDIAEILAADAALRNG